MNLMDLFGLKGLATEHLHGDRWARRGHSKSRNHQNPGKLRKHRAKRKARNAMQKASRAANR